MRDAAGKLADRLHLLRLPQLLLGLFAGRDFLHQVGGALLDPLFERGGQLRQRGSLGGQLRQQIVAFDFGHLARGDVGGNADQRFDAAIRPAHRPRADVDPMLRSVGPDVAVFDAVVAAGLDGPFHHLGTPGPIVGMNRGQQILVRKGLARLASEECLAGVGSLELELRQMQFQRPEMTGVQRGLQQAFAFGKIRKDGAGLVLAAAAPDGGADNAHQRGRMKGPLDKGDIAEHLAEPHGIRIALGTATLMRQQHDRKIRP
jgi:hypothetical protein